MLKISPETTIGELFAAYPESIKVFTANGFSENCRQILDAKLRLKTILQVKGLNEKLFINLLEEKIQQDEFITLLQTDKKGGQKLDFLGFTYCPIKYVFKECFEEVKEKYLAETKDMDFTYSIPFADDSEEDSYEKIWHAEDIDDFPDITLAAGFDTFLHQKFIDKFIKTGCFKSISYPEIHEAFRGGNFIDPAGNYTVYSMLPIVMLIDLKKLGSLPVPKQWSDLLKPIYHHNIIIGAAHDDIFEDLFLYTHKEHGNEGVIKLAPNIKAWMHASQMSKLAGSASSEGAAIYIIPWIFAKTCPRIHDTLIVWPEDGALATPMYMLVKEKCKKNLQPFIDFVMGYRYGQKSADNFFPVFNATVDNKLPPNARFKWLGWDYIMDHNMEELKVHVMSIFRTAWRVHQNRLTDKGDCNAG